MPQAVKKGAVYQLVHAAGCPRVEEAPTFEKRGKDLVQTGTREVSAVESYLETRPARPDQPARRVQVVRCKKCTAHLVMPAGAEFTEIVHEIGEEFDDGDEGEGQGGG